MLSGTKGVIFGILFYGSLLLTPFCLLGLAVCGFMLIWEPDAFRTRWTKYRTWIFCLSIPIIVSIASVTWLHYHRSFPNGYHIVYMSSDACNMCHGSSVVIDQHIIEYSIVTNGNIVSGELGSGEMFSLNTTTGNVTYTKPATTDIGTGQTATQ